MRKHCPFCFDIGLVCADHPDRAWHPDLGCMCSVGMLCECNEVKCEQKENSLVIEFVDNPPFEENK
jgi:hypothetical protein